LLHVLRGCADGEERCECEQTHYDLQFHESSKWVYLLRERAPEMRGYTCAARFRQGSGETQLFNCVVIRDAVQAREVASGCFGKVFLCRALVGAAREKFF